MSHFRSALLLLLAAAAVSPAAAAAAPANDERGNATSLDPLPTTVQGTTEGATRAQDDPGSCGPAGDSVWYSATAAEAGRIAVKATAAGDLDMVVDVFRRVRSRLDPVACDVSDSRGIAQMNFQSAKGDRYYVRVSEVFDSVPGTFSLHVSAPFTPATPPGRALPRGGATAVLNRAENSDDAWSVVLHSGTTYRLRLSGRLDSCRPIAQVFAPGTTSFDGSSPVRIIACGHSLTVTPRPGEGGRYSIRVVASPSARLDQGYHLQVAPAGADDTAPGIGIHNHRRADGALQGDRIDATDLYRFTIDRRSQTVIKLTSGQEFGIDLLREDGSRLGSAGTNAGLGSATVSRVLGRGTYFVSVHAHGSAAGGYRLRRDSRVVTHTRLQAAVPSRTFAILTSTTPEARGPLEIVVERFDPLAGWLFADRFALHVSNGRAHATFTGHQGRYRARATFPGTRDFGDSVSRMVHFRLWSH